MEDLLRSHVSSDYGSIVHILTRVHSTFESDTKRIEVGTLNKRLVLQIRALYSYLRMMPAYKLFRDRIKQKNTSYQLNYKFTRPDQSSGAAEFGAGKFVSSKNSNHIRRERVAIINVSLMQSLSCHIIVQLPRDQELIWRVECLR